MGSKSRETGLEIGLIFLKFVAKTEYLHYGYFADDLPVDLWTFGEAQERYADELVDLIPEGVERILDVGCGSGKTAQKLVALGYDVEAVSPSAMLNEYARDLLGESTPVHTARFEDFTCDRTFDLVLFSESFQYIPAETALRKAIECLGPDGYIIVSDFFRRDDEQEERGPLGGGHRWTEWMDVLPKFPLRVLHERDITKETSRTLDIVNAFTMDVLQPSYRLAVGLGDHRYPRLMRFVKWKLKKELAKLENKHFKGERSAANFEKYKRYMLYLFQLES